MIHQRDELRCLHMNMETKVVVFILTAPRWAIHNAPSRTHNNGLGFLFSESDSRPLKFTSAPPPPSPLLGATHTVVSGCHSGGH